MNPLPAHPVKSMAPPTSCRSATIATIDLSALAHNLTEVRRSISPSCQVLAVVKADAYGHGAVAICRALSVQGVMRFGVATLEEGIALREAGISSPVLVMGATLPSAWNDAAAYGLTPVVYDADQAARLAECFAHQPGPYPVHLKIETGMGRLGLLPEQVLPLLESKPFNGIFKVEGLMTHLAEADDEDPAFTSLQLERFRSVVSQIEAAGLHVPLVHAANSAAILRHPASHFTAVRPGIMLYGYHTLTSQNDGPSLKPVLSLTTKIAQLRMMGRGESVSYNRTHVASGPSRVAVLPVGYADGYNRLLSNRGVVLVRGRRAPVVGRVCMDMTMVDVTEIPAVRTGDDVTLIGCQGKERITAAELAASLGTIPYEVLCAIGPRVPRICQSRPPHSEHEPS